ESGALLQPPRLVGGPAHDVDRIPPRVTRHGGLIPRDRPTAPSGASVRGRSARGRQAGDFVCLPARHTEMLRPNDWSAIASFGFLTTCRCARPHVSHWPMCAAAACGSTPNAVRSGRGALALLSGRAGRGAGVSFTGRTAVASRDAFAPPLVGCVFVCSACFIATLLHPSQASRRANANVQAACLRFPWKRASASAKSVTVPRDGE